MSADIAGTEKAGVPMKTTRIREPSDAHFGFRLRVRFFELG